MDHLKSNDERKSRWYATHIRPRYLHVTRRMTTGNDESDPESERDVKDSIAGIPAAILSRSSPDYEDGRRLLRSDLDRRGFAIVTDALTRSECEEATGLLWDYLETSSVVERCIQEERGLRGKRYGPDKKSEQVTNLDAVAKCDDVENDDDLVRELQLCPPPVQRDDPSTHSSPHFPHSVEGGIFPYYGSGHSTFGWFLRSRPIVTQVFAAVHGIEAGGEGKGEDLIASLDGLVAWRAGPEHRADADAGWFHLDQNPRTKPGFEAVQGLVNLLPVSRSTGGNALVLGSHKLFPHHFLGGNGSGSGHDGIGSGSTSSDCSEFYQKRLDEIDGDDWMEIDRNDEVLLDPKNVVTCLLGPGDMLLWDSRVAHCSYPGCDDFDGSHDIPTPPPHPDASGTNGLIRAAGLISMAPSSHVSDDALCARMDAVDRSRTLTHWVNKVAPLGEEREGEVAAEEERVGWMRRIGRSGGGTVLVGREELARDYPPSCARLVWGNFH